jgi:hypothetical protein
MNVCDLCRKDPKSGCLEPDVTMGECLAFQGDIAKIKRLVRLAALAVTSITGDFDLGVTVKYADGSHEHRSWAELGMDSIVKDHALAALVQSPDGRDGVLVEQMSRARDFVWKYAKFMVDDYDKALAEVRRVMEEHDLPPHFGSTASPPTVRDPYALCDDLEGLT